MLVNDIDRLPKLSSKVLNSVASSFSSSEFEGDINDLFDFAILDHS